jgi:hypothetical protein
MEDEVQIRRRLMLRGGFYPIIIFIICRGNACATRAKRVDKIINAG